MSDSTALTRIHDDVINALRKRFPNANSEQLEAVSVALFKKLISSIRAGDQLATLKQNSDGTLDLTVWVIKALRELETDKNGH